MTPWIIAVYVCLLKMVIGSNDVLPPNCEHEIYCHGDLLHTVQMAKLYHDSKTFVDMKLKEKPDIVLSKFESLMKTWNRNPPLQVLEAFVNDTFDPPGSEFEDWDPVDWIDHPRFLNNIVDSELKLWASRLNTIWKSLGRKMKDDVKINSDLYSLIYVPHPLIVPGGRFREFYYWDSYWIIKGLLLSEMYGTAKGMLENFLSIVNKYGFVPNGGRIYYSRRSQPPMLIPMVKSYIEANNDLQFLKDNIETLEKELHFWLTNYTVSVKVNGKNYTLARYNGISAGPRPESYREDYKTAEIFTTEEAKQDFYLELKTGAESGWDYSTRWYIQNKTNCGNLTDLKVRSILPVDLNALLYWNAVILSDFFQQLGKPEKAAQYAGIADVWREAVNNVLWDEEVGVWLDYDMLNGIRRNYFSVSNIFPLWTKCFDTNQGEFIIGKVMKYLEKSKALKYPGGVPATLEFSREQWDYPNAWPPLQYAMIMGLDATGDISAKQLAFELAERWIWSNYMAFNKTDAMYEKYDCTVSGIGGGGGEYQVQLGFGWSNGIILELLEKYGDRLTANELGLPPIQSIRHNSSPTETSGYITVILGVLLTLVTGAIGYYIYKKKTQGEKSTLFNKHGGYVQVDTTVCD